MWFFFVSFLVAAAVSFWTYRSKQQPTNPVTHVEYWVYMRGVELPDLKELMERLVAKNPYSKGGISPVGTPEGLIMSDIRFHHALVLREKNAHVFRPDLFSLAVQASSDQLSELSECHGMAKLRYVSETPVNDRRHLQFLIHAADATAALSGSNLIFDSISEKLYTKQEFEDLLKADRTGLDPSYHVRVVWHPNQADGHAATLGLRKMGIREMITAPVSGDEKWLATEVLEQAALQQWEHGTALEEMSATAYEDSFRVIPADINGDQVTVRIMRVQSI